MHKINIETLRNDAKRQIQLLKELLQKAQQKGLIDAPAKIEDERATFDTKSLQEALQILDGESHKLDHLDMVLAVVGTMKAGKSTSINSIVGAEVLPNRNRPMTALPTLIRHTPGVLIPRLIFEKVKPINDLLVALGKAVRSANPKTMAELRGDKDMADLLGQIQQKKPFASKHNGEEKIFHFLKGLNDLVRLSSALNVKFPFDAYASVNAMPVIEVEFSHLSHLKETTATQGRLTLLDTPGPNEAGQDHLKDMLKDQLKKASAVLAVLDYTQLKSEADADIRKKLMEISDTAKGRMYALVNKFDQKDRNSDDAETVKRYVAQTLMENELNEGSVFPVSSLRGYLASRARNEIKRNQKLPACESWVEDFGNLALGTAWDEQSAADVLLMQKAADGLWNKSGFALPLEKVIVEAYQNAALEALRSAASKLDSIAKDAGDFFKANAGALKKSAAALKKNIDNLHEDIANINHIEAVTKDKLDDSLEQMRINAEASAKKVQEEISQMLHAYFKEGKKIEVNNQEKATRKNNSKKNKETGAASIWGFPLSPKKKSDEDCKQDFDPKSPIIKFDEKTEAKDFKEKIENSIRSAVFKTEEDFKKCIQSGIDDFSRDLAKHRADSMEKIRKSVQNNLDDIDITITLPNIQDLSLGIPVSDILKDAIEEKSKSVTKHRRKSGAWGTLCSWFNTDDWGWESYEVDKEYYQVDIEKIKKSSNKGIEILFSSVNQTLEENVYPELQGSAKEFFEAFRKKVEHVRGDLMKNIQTHNLDKNKKDAILKDSEEMAREASGLEKDCTVLNDSAETLRREEGVTVARGEVRA